MNDINTPIALLYTEIIGNARNRNRFSDRDLFEVTISKDGYDEVFPLVCEHIKIKLNKLLALDDYRAYLKFEPNLVNYHSYKYSDRLQIIISYDIRRIKSKQII